MKRIVLFMAVLILGSCQKDVATPPTDWQVDGLKGKVKKMTKLYSHDSGKKYKEEISYNEVGYRTSKRCEANYFLPEHYGQLELIANCNYSAYKKGERSIVVHHYSPFSKSIKEVKDKEYWLATNVNIYLFDNVSDIVKATYRLDNTVKSIKKNYTVDNRLVREDYLDKDEVSLGTNTYTYDRVGGVVQKVYNYTNQYYVLDGDEMNSVKIKKDDYGNVIKQKFEPKNSTEFYIEEFTYEYY